MPRQVTKKNDVVDAALALFMKQGIKGTTTRDIALRAGASEGTIYRHFESKDELARIVFEQNLDFFWRFLRNYLKETQGVEEVLGAFVEGFFEFARRYQIKYSFLFAAHQTELRKLSRRKMKPLRMLARIIRLGQKQGHFREIDPDLAAAMLVGTISQTIFYLKSGLIAVGYEDVISETKNACLNILRREKVIQS